MLVFNLAISWLDHVQFTLIHGPNIPGYCVILFFIALDFTFTTRHIHNWVSFLLWPSCFILSGAIGNWPLFFPSSILDTFWPGGVHLLVSYRFSFSYCLWGFQGKNTGVGCHFLLQWIMFCQNSSLWPVHLAWSCMAWFIASLSYTSPFATTRLWSMKGFTCHNKWKMINVWHTWVNRKSAPSLLLKAEDRGDPTLVSLCFRIWLEKPGVK